MIDVSKLNLPTEGPVAEALGQFSVHNMMLGAEILRDAAYHAVAKAARQRGWPCETQEQTYAAIEKLDSDDELHLMSSYLHAEGLPDKIRYSYDTIVDGEIEMDCWAIDIFLERMQALTEQP